MKIGFCGGTSQARALNADAERCLDLLPEMTESPSAQSSLELVDRPGAKIFCVLGATASLGGWACQPNGSTTDRDFEVVQNGVNQSLIEVFQDGSKIGRGDLQAPTTSNVTFADNGIQLAICTGGQIWVFTYATNVLSGPVAGLNAAVALIDASDGFGIAVLSNSNKFQLSKLLDFTTWPGLSVAQVSEFPDNVISMIVNQRGIWFQGRKATVPYYNAGFLDVPFIPVQGVYIEGGAASVLGRAKLDNSIFWWDASERGRGIARRANGYIPQRISTHSIEIIVGSYPDISDAISWAEEREGHTLFVTYFPSGTGADGKPGAGATWVFDISTGLWSEWSYWNAKGGFREAYHGRNHRFAWGKHLVGDWASGNLYQTDFPRRNAAGWDFTTDAGSPIVRRRVGPSMSNENQRQILNRLTLILETGISPQPPLTGPSDYPQAYYIPDVNGKVWQLTCDDKAILHVDIAPPAAIADTIILTDAPAITSYQLTVGLDANGLFNGTLASPVGFDPGAQLSLPIATTSFLDCSISMSNGQAQTSVPVVRARGPQITFRQSKDGGHTWSQPRSRDCGQAGEYRKRVFWNRLGQMRTWTPEITFSDPVPLRIVDAYLEGEPA